MPMAGFQSDLHLSSCSRLVIGIVNNMPDGALHTTERQFRKLLFTAAKNFEISLRFFSLPGVPRGDEAKSYVGSCYENIDLLWSNRLDGLIVTGTEPRAKSLTDEPYWFAIKKLVDQAEEHGTSTIWSCLAAHAAVLHLDGVQRCPLNDKLSGIFECSRVAHHELVACMPSRWYVPHSRHNSLPEPVLVTKGYHILSRSPDIGADIFVRKRRSRFIFLQGHLEYDADALLREYRRDIRRYLVGARENYPLMPRNYFDRETESALVSFEARAMTDRSPEMLMHFPRASGNFAHSWSESAVSIYQSWLSCLTSPESQV